MSTHLLIVDRHQMARTAISDLAASPPSTTFVAEAESLDEAVFQVQRSKPDVILLGLPLGRGIEAAIRRLHHIAPNARVVVLSLDDDPAYIRAARRAGAAAYLRKDQLTASLTSLVDDLACPPNTLPAVN